ncbi:MAG: L-threonylcarbamoyladenylate synthase [Nitrospirota bacterium]|jgi:L-threonylcarbamoyladenylate synthase
MEVIKVKGGDIREALDRALRVLGGGGIVAYPTETFYGLGARFNDASALKRLLEIKGRASDKPLSLIVGTEASLSLVAAEVTETARRLIDSYWPGPLTILFRAREGLHEALSLEGKVAVRVPGESVGLHLARALAFPITATSANPAGGEPPSRAEEAARLLPEGVDLLIDAGPTPGGKPSTVVDASGDEMRLVRPGAVEVPGLT